MESKFKAFFVQCSRCQHVWLKRVEKPRQCPRCKNTRWNQRKKSDE